MADDLPDDWWTTEQVARFLNVTTSTLRAYQARGQMPAPDRKMGPLSLWKPSTIQAWDNDRPRRRSRETGRSS